MLLIESPLYDSLGMHAHTYIHTHMSTFLARSLPGMVVALLSVATWQAALAAFAEWQRGALVELIIGANRFSHLVSTTSH